MFSVSICADPNKGCILVYINYIQIKTKTQVFFLWSYTKPYPLKLTQAIWKIVSDFKSAEALTNNSHKKGLQEMHVIKKIENKKTNKQKKNYIAKL